jgi:hypothetical protein
MQVGVKPLKITEKPRLVGKLHQKTGENKPLVGNLRFLAL